MESSNLIQELDNLPDLVKCSDYDLKGCRTDFFLSEDTLNPIWWICSMVENLFLNPIECEGFNFFSQ